MIYIERPEAPDFLTDEDGIWIKETNEAIEHYQDAEAEPFIFKKYRSSRVKDELAKIFFKCAYCESTYQASSDGDIEHFRPKGKIKEIDRTPGYYWLANDWNNLLLSCQHCNQLRRHEILDSEDIHSLGKKDQFPLKDESNRMNGPEDDFEEEEKLRLLINPCIEDPAEHFTYDETVPVMIHQTDMAETSIKVYALQRSKLVKERQKVKIHLFLQIQQTKKSLEAWNEHPEINALKDLYKSAYDLMMSFTEQNKQYAGMCRFYVKKFLVENGLIGQPEEPVL